MTFPSSVPVRLETSTLADVDDSYYYGVSCSACRHSARLSLERLRDRLGAQTPLKDIRPRLRCRQCGSRRIIITFLTPAHRTGSMIAWFEEQAV